MKIYNLNKKSFSLFFFLVFFMALPKVFAEKDKESKCDDWLCIRADNFILKLTGQYEKLEKICQQLFSDQAKNINTTKYSFPHFIDSELCMAGVLLKQKKLQEAEAFLHQKYAFLFQKNESAKKEKRDLEQSKIDFYTQLTKVYLEQNKYDKAVTYFQKAIQIFSTQNKIINIASENVHERYKFDQQLEDFRKIASLSKKKGHYKFAIRVLKNIQGLYLKKYKGDHGADRPYLLVLDNEIAKLYQKQKNYKKAEEYFLKTETLAKKLGFFPHQGLGEFITPVFVDLAEFYGEQKEKEPALKYAQKAKDKIFKTFAENKKNKDEIYSSNFSWLLTRLAQVYSQFQNPEQALELLETALKIRKQKLYPKHIRVSEILIEIAKIHQKQNRIQKANQFFTEAYHLLDNFSDKDILFYQNLPQTLTNLAELSQKLGKKDIAQKLLARANQPQFILFKSSTDPIDHTVLFVEAVDSFHLQRSEISLGIRLSNKGEAAQQYEIIAYKHFLNSVEKIRDYEANFIIGFNPFYFLQTKYMDRLGYLYLNNKKYAQAEAMFSNSLQLYDIQKNYPKHHRMFEGIVFGLADALIAQKKTNKAHQVLKKNDLFKKWQELLEKEKSENKN